MASGEQRDLDVANVRAGWSGEYEVVERAEKMIAVVVAKMCGRVERACRCTFHRGRVNNCTGGVGRSVNAVGADAAEHGSNRPRCRRCRRRVLVATSLTVGQLLDERH